MQESNIVLKEDPSDRRRSLRIQKINQSRQSIASAETDTDIKFSKKKSLGKKRIRKEKAKSVKKNKAKNVKKEKTKSIKKEKTKSVKRKKTKSRKKKNKVVHPPVIVELQLPPDLVTEVLLHKQALFLAKKEKRKSNLGKRKKRSLKRKKDMKKRIDISIIVQKINDNYEFLDVKTALSSSNTSGISI